MNEIAVFDVETTGFSPARGDRIVEIAIVRITPDGEVLDEWSTLINPERDPGPSSIHGIIDEHLVQAPTFDQVAGEISERLAGGVIAGHNVAFDLGFLSAEFAKLGHAMPPVPALCTVRMARQANMPTPRTLQACCARMGVRLEAAHSAYGDAMATAQLILACASGGTPIGGAVRTYTPKQIGPQWPSPGGYANACMRPSMAPA